MGSVGSCMAVCSLIPLTVHSCQSEKMVTIASKAGEMHRNAGVIQTDRRLGVGGGGSDGPQYALPCFAKKALS